MFRKDAVLDSKTSHLIVGRLRRTEKLLCAIASGRPSIVLADSLVNAAGSSWVDHLAKNVGDAGQSPSPNGVYIPHKAKRDQWASAGGFFARETAVILLTDNEAKAKVKRVFEAGGATVLPRYFLVLYVCHLLKLCGKVQHFNLSLPTEPSTT